MLHWIHYNKKIGDCENIYSANPLYPVIGKVDGHIVFDFTDENKEVLKKYTELWNGIKNEIETINSSKKDEYGKDFLKIKFYPQLYLDGTVYEL